MQRKKYKLRYFLKSLENYEFQCLAIKILFYRKGITGANYIPSFQYHFFIQEYALRDLPLKRIMKIDQFWIYFCSERHTVNFKIFQFWAALNLSETLVCNLRFSQWISHGPVMLKSVLFLMAKLGSVMSRISFSFLTVLLPRDNKKRKKEILKG